MLYLSADKLAFSFELTLITAKDSSEVGAIRAYMPSSIVIAMTKITNSLSSCLSGLDGNVLTN